MSPIEATDLDNVIVFEGYDYNDALLGVTEDGRAVYVYEKMVARLIEKQGITQEEAVEWIEHNTTGATSNAGPLGPLIIYSV